MNRIDRSHGGDIAEDNLIWADPHDGPVCLKELLDGLALAEADNVDVEPEVRDGGIPGAGDCAEGRDKKVVEGADKKVDKGGRGETKE
jgi:hypothetical protein